jgi:hypothetical protein
MKEFMLLIRNGGDSKAAFSPEKNQDFLNACRVYIEKLTKNGNLKRAQPLIREGKMLSGSNNQWMETSFNEGKEVIVGYYHILANNLDDAIAIAKGNPEFEYTTTARIEVRPVKTMEESTSYAYPKGE